MAVINKKTFKKALVNSGGNQSTIAKALNKTRGAVSQFLAKNPDMRKLCDTEAERIIDVAENVVDAKITNDQDLDTAKWKLANSKRGKARGYGAKQEIEHIGDSLGVTFNIVEKSVEEIKSEKLNSKSKADRDAKSSG